MAAIKSRSEKLIVGYFLSGEQNLCHTVFESSTSRGQKMIETGTIIGSCECEFNAVKHAMIAEGIELEQVMTWYDKRSNACRTSKH